MQLCNLGLNKTKIKAKPEELGIKRNYYITLTITNSDVEIGFRNFKHIIARLQENCGLYVRKWLSNFFIHFRFRKSF
jgi:hypothetical protein